MTINWFDIVLLIGVIVIAIRGYFRGAIGFLIWSVGGVLSALLSRFLAKNIAPWIYENFVRQSIERKVTGIITETFQQGMDTIGDSIFNTMPSFMWQFTDYDDVVYALDSVTGNSLEEISASASEIVSRIVEPIYIAIIGAVMTIILFLIFNIAIGIVCKVTGVFNKIPIVGGVNRALGVGLGALYGCFLAWILACVIAIVAPVFDRDGVFREKVETDSFVFNVINKNADGIYFGKNDDEEMKEDDDSYQYDDDDYNGYGEDDEY